MNQQAAPANYRRHSEGEQHAANIELFFDLVYVFAITQLSGLLVTTSGLAPTLRTALLFAMVWMVWSYTMWVTNWLDPERLPIRLMLFALMAGSLWLAAGLPEAFTTRGIWVGGAYAAMQVGRSAVAVWGLRGDPLEANFRRILVWCVASGGLAIAGGLVSGDARVVLWAAAVGVDVLGGSVGFAVPGMGRSSTADWAVEGHHMAERCQAFVLIALGESIVRIGETYSDQHLPSGAQSAALFVALVGALALWWMYFDRSADAATAVIVASEDPGRLGRSAYHLIHPVMIAGIVVIAAADQEVVAAPTRTVDARVSWLILGGTALYIAGHAAFKAVVWRVVPLTRIVGVVVLGLLAVATGHVTRIGLGAMAGVVVVAVVVSDRFVHPAPDRGGARVGAPLES